jgi:hypothetical protein
MQSVYGQWEFCRTVNYCRIVRYGCQHRAVELFASSLALMTFLQRATKIFLLIHSRHVMYDTQIKKNQPIKNAQSFFCCPTRMQRASLQLKLSTTRLTEACLLARRTLRKGMYHTRYRPQSSPSLLSAVARGCNIILASIYRTGSALFYWSVVMSLIDLNKMHKIDKVSNKT